MRNESNHGKWIAVGAAALATVLIGVNVQSSLAFPRYTDGCNNSKCHGAFNDDTSPKGTQFPNGGKHEMHRGARYMNSECELCHIVQGDDPFTFMSAGTDNNPGVGCTGCHGRDYRGAIGNTAAGLRRHHFNNDITICAGCHFDDPEPLPENVVPTYYNTPDTLVTDPCNPFIPPDSWGENFSTDTDNNRGLDNDGDNLYDENDPDCDTSCPCDCAPPPDGLVNVTDFLFMLGQWGGPGSCDCAQPPDGVVNVTDFLFMLGFWGTCP